MPFAKCVQIEMGKEMSSHTNVYYKSISSFSDLIEALRRDGRQ
jgi:hypothetical protein